MSRVLLFLLIFGFSIEASVAENNGPNDCLMMHTDQCPVDFMLRTLCLVNPSLCIYRPETDNYSLNVTLFFSLYNLSFDFHDTYEQAICDSSPASCNPGGINGLTIYQAACPTCRNDSRICQVTPEVCTGYSQN